MAFLALNGFELPVYQQNTPKYEEGIIGEKYGSYSGMIISSIQEYRRKWTISTAPITQAEMTCLKGIVNGKGHSFGFDGTLYSCKNLPGTFSRASVRYLSDGTSISSGNPGYDDGPNITADSNDQSIWIEESTTPIFGAYTFLDTDTNLDGIADNFTAYATGGATGTRSMDATTVTFGLTASQKIVKSDGGIGNFGIQSAYTAVSYPNSCKVLIDVTALSSGASVVIEADYYNSTGGYLGVSTHSYSAVTSGFEDCQLSSYYNTLTAYVYVFAYVTGANGTFYLQAVTSENKYYNTSWTDVSRSAEVLYYNPSIFNKFAYTLGFWYKPTNTQIVANRYVSLLDIYIDSDNYWKMVIAPDGIPYFAIKGKGSEVNSYISTDTPLTLNTWYFIACHGDESNFTMTVNGVEMDRGTTGDGYVIPVGTLGNIFLGCNSSSTSHANGVYSDLIIIPFRATTECILAYYNMARPFYPLPQLELYGDYIRRDVTNPIIVQGLFNSYEAITTAAGTRYILNFDLIEIL